METALLVISMALLVAGIVALSVLGTVCLHMKKEMESLCWKVDGLFGDMLIRRNEQMENWKAQRELDELFEKVMNEEKAKNGL